MAQLLWEANDDLLLSVADLIGLEDANIPGGAFAVRPLDRDNLEGLLLSDPAYWPKITVTRCAAGYILIDGYHRREAAKRLQIATLKARCVGYGNQNDVVEAAFRANLRHGLKAGTESKGDYAYWLHITYPHLEQNDIAKRVGMTQGAVSKAIARREREAKAALQEGVTDPEEQQRHLKKSCRTFTRMATRFLEEVELVDDTELVRLLQATMKKGERNKLARIGRLLGNEEAGAQASPPLRLRQFVGPGLS